MSKFNLLSIIVVLFSLLVACNKVESANTDSDNYYVKYAQDGSEAPVRYSLTIQPSIKVFLADSVNSNPTEYFSNNPPRRGAGHKLLNTYSSSAAYTYLRPMMDPRHSDASNVAWADGHVSTEKKAWRNLQGTIKKYRWDPLEKDPKK